MIWPVMIACGLLTFATRFVMFSGLAPRRLPDWLEDALGFVPIAVLTAIIVPAVIGVLADRTSQEALGWVSLVVVVLMSAMWAAVRANAPTGSATPAS